MRLLDYFRLSREKTAHTAKERLKVIIAHERAYRNGPDYLPKLRDEILLVIRKYIPVMDEQVKFKLERDGDCEVLELNVMIPEENLEEAS